MAAVLQFETEEPTTLQIVVRRAETPRDQRREFAIEVRAAIERALARGEVAPEVAEELWRVIPDPERA